MVRNALIRKRDFSQIIENGSQFIRLKRAFDERNRFQIGNYKVKRGLTSYFLRMAKRVTRGLLKGFSRKTPIKIHFEARQVCCVKVEKNN